MAGGENGRSGESAEIAIISPLFIFRARILHYSNLECTQVNYPRLKPGAYKRLRGTKQ